MPAQRTGGASVETWGGWYYIARDEMEFRYGVRRVPKDSYKEQFALGRTPQQAAKAIYQRIEVDALMKKAGR